MKLKFINLLLASTLLVGSAQVFTSCKDNEADMYNGLKQENLTLYETVMNDLKPAIIALDTKVENYYAELKGKDADLESKIAALSSTSGTQATDISNLATELANVKSEMLTTEQVQAMIDEIKIPEIPADLSAEVLALQQKVSELESTLSTLNGTVTALSGTVTGLSTDVEALKTWKSQWENVLPDVVNTANDAKAKAEKNAADIAALQAVVDQLKSCNCDPTVITSLEARVTALEGEVVKLRQEAAANLAEAKAYTDALSAELTPKINANTTSINEVKTLVNTLQSTVTTLQGDVNELKTKVAKNASDIANIQSELGKLLNRVEYLENRVTSVIMQEVDNHIYGTLLTPFGISSNVLIAFAGTTPAEREFPSMDYEYDNSDPLTMGDLRILQQCGLQLATVPAGTVINRADNNLGTVYFTVNPGNINLNGKTFTLVNSLGETQGIELRNVAPSFHKVEHGYDASRSLTNGFYEADAYIAPDQVGNINFVIDEGLKTAVANVLKAGRHNNGGTVAALAKALYQQVDGILPAYAISANWTEDGKALTTTGQYNMAVATVKPLSFTTLYGKHINKHIPDLGQLLDKFENKVHVSLDGDSYHITLDKTFTIPGCDIQIRNVSIQISDLSTDVIVKVPVYANYNDKENGVEPIAWAEGTIDVDFQDEDLVVLNQKLSQQINEALQNAGYDIQTSVDNMINDIQQSVVDMLTSMETTVNSTIDDVLADLQGKINGKIESFVDRVEGTRVYDIANKVVDKLNDVIADPNHYLQVGLFYKSGSRVGLMSSMKTKPTVLNTAGGANAVLLIPTTLTAEVVCPAYEKFVAVTNVYNGSASAQGGDAKCLQLLKQANEQKLICEVLDGRHVTAPLYFNGGKGYTYEITYQAIDYTGVTSTQKYYVKIK